MVWLWLFIGTVCVVLVVAMIFLNREPRSDDDDDFGRRPVAATRETSNEPDNEG